MKYIENDIGKKVCVVCIMDENGNVLEKTSYYNTFDDANSFARYAIQKYGQCVAVLESTGNLWLKTYEAFERNGMGFANLTLIKTRAIAEAQIKTDTLDAQTLAHLLRSNLVAECYIAPREIRNNKTVLRHRESLVWNRTAITNKMRSLLDKYDLHCKYDEIHGTRGIIWLEYHA